MIRERRFAAAATLALALALTTACAPDPAPTPSPTGFASQEEAFAAAEATYRAYVDALNAVDLSDPATFEPVYSTLSGEALANEKKSLTNMHAENWTVSGASQVTAFFPESADDTVSALSCLNVSNVTLVDDSGASQVAADRPDVYAFQLDFLPSGEGGNLTIDSAVATEDSRCG